jgi:hypothetical protein
MISGSLDSEKAEVEVVRKPTLGKGVSGQQKISKTVVTSIPGNGTNGVDDLEHCIIM